MSPTCIPLLQSYVQRRGINYSLTRLTNALTQLGNPEKKVPPTIHIAGTNGKGSVLHYLRGIFSESGYSIGHYSSPHIYDYPERIGVNGTSIDDKQFDFLFHTVDSCVTDPLSEYEILTLMAFLYFSKYITCDILLLETGLGGRLDATNVVTPILSVITKIGLDHTDILGSDIAQIATEKAGIIKPYVPVVTLGSQPQTAYDIIRSTAALKKSTLHIATPDPSDTCYGYQAENMALAKLCRTVLNKRFSQSKSISSKKMSAYAPWGRLNTINLKRKNDPLTIIIDGAHNRPGLVALIEYLSQQHPGQTPCFICGFKQGKDLKKMVDYLAHNSNTLYFCDFQDPLSCTKEELPRADLFHTYTLESPLPNQPLIVFTGSLYFLSKLYRYWDGKSGLHIPLSF